MRQRGVFAKFVDKRRYCLRRPPFPSLSLEDGRFKKCVRAAGHDAALNTRLSFIFVTYGYGYNAAENRMESVKDR